MYFLGRLLNDDGGTRNSGLFKQDSIIEDETLGTHGVNPERSLSSDAMCHRLLLLSQIRDTSQVTNLTSYIELRYQALGI